MAVAPRGIANAIDKVRLHPAWNNPSLCGNPETRTSGRQQIFYLKAASSKWMKRLSFKVSTQPSYMARLVERAAELMSLPTASTSLPTPPIVLQETHPRRVAILRIINLLFIVLLEVFRIIRLHSFIPRSKNRQSCHKASCHSPFLPCVPETLKKHAPTEKMPGGYSAPITRNHYYLLPK